MVSFVCENWCSKAPSGCKLAALMEFAIGIFEKPRVSAGWHRAQVWPRTAAGNSQSRDTTNEVEHLLRTAQENLDLRDYAVIFSAVRAGLHEGQLAALAWGDIVWLKETTTQTGSSVWNATMTGALVAKDAHPEEPESAACGREP